MAALARCVLLKKRLVDRGPVPEATSVVARRLAACREQSAGNRQPGRMAIRLVFRFIPVARMRHVKTGIAASGAADIPARDRLHRCRYSHIRGTNIRNVNEFKVILRRFKVIL